MAGFSNHRQQSTAIERPLTSHGVLDVSGRIVQQSMSAPVAWDGVCTMSQNLYAEQLLWRDPD